VDPADRCPDSRVRKTSYQVHSTVILFGSWARGDARPDTDLDFHRCRGVVGVMSGKQQLEDAVEAVKAFCESRLPPTGIFWG
jgi:predicted nucleotidyltransferase